jgi:Nucleotidyltransferase of unknown function (DUF6036)
MLLSQAPQSEIHRVWSNNKNGLQNLEKMIQLIETALEIQDFLESNSWKFCFIGGLALQRWGEERVTKDVDITLLTGFGFEDDFILKLAGKFRPRLENAEEFARRNRVLLLQNGNIGIDIALGALPFEEKATDRATYHNYTPNISLKTCSAEDLIVSKAFADRTRDWADIESVVQKQLTLDWDYILEQLTPLVELKYAPEILDKLRLTKTKYYQK